MKSIFAFIIPGLAIAISLVGCKNNDKNGGANYLTRNDWCENVKTNLNQLIEKNKNANNYVVFDFDNTSSIFDVGEQTFIYQLKHMNFNANQHDLFISLSEGYDINRDIDNFTYHDLIDDLCSSYEYLSGPLNFGPFTYEGVPDNKLEELYQEEHWKNFSSKLIQLYNFVTINESTNISYPLVTYLFYGMSEDEVYKVAKRSHTYYKDIESNTETIISSYNEYTNSLATFTNGVSVSQNIVELMKAFKENNIDVWICSASNIDVVRAAIDVFGLHDYVTGLIGMTNKHIQGKMINEYDYDSYGYLTSSNSTWIKDTYKFKAMPLGKGKVTAIKNALLPRYGKGPIAGFMDSTGDFNFCTEFSSLQLVTCFNRADRSIEDGGGLIASIAMYQQDTLKWDLNDAAKSGDTLYLLQGRNENGLRGLRNSNKTIKLGDSTETLFKNDDNFTLLNYLKQSNLSIKQLIDLFAIKTSASSLNNPLGLNYGFLSDYNGYHSI